MNALVKTALVAGFIGAGVATVAGRQRTRVDNLLVGGLVTALTAYRDPRATDTSTWIVAAVEGLAWGLTDRLVPALKDLIVPG
jgi:hypothetical protein